MRTLRIVAAPLQQCGDWPGRAAGRAAVVVRPTPSIHYMNLCLKLPRPMDLARRGAPATGQPAPGLLPALDFASSQPHAELPLLVQKPTRDAAGTCDAGPRVLFDRQCLLRLRVQHTNTDRVRQRDSRRRAALKRRGSPHRAVACITTHLAGLCRQQCSDAIPTSGLASEADCQKACCEDAQCDAYQWNSDQSSCIKGKCLALVPMTGWSGEKGKSGSGSDPKPPPGSGPSIGPIPESDCAF